jgi:hypothetical protein
MLFRGTPGADWGELWGSIWLSTLAGILGLARLAPRTLGLVFVIFAWWVPVLITHDQANATGLARGISHPVWSAEGILPMLVPHLLAMGYVCLERAQR